ncbi:MAG TPA: HNH endonuclease signature motif containing protein [Candidatus Acidoferrales bacterium]|nr:HNH endonuclease signature motif containing protein [Candidatus Acidoferrales bacterium]
MPKAIRVEKTCDQCGARFFVKPSHANQRFCARSCQTAHEAVHGRLAGRYERKDTHWFFCRQCGVRFPMKPGYLTQYRTKFGKDPMYCSIKCSALGRRADSDERNKGICKQCGQEYYRTRRGGSGTIYREQELCSRECKNAWLRTLAEHRFNAGVTGRHVKSNGYVWLSIPANISGDGKKREVMEHRWVMEQTIGRPLEPGETVHHKDGDRANNTIENLALFVSNHGPGQEVVDIVAWCVKMLTRYRPFITPEDAEAIRSILGD